MQSLPPSSVTPTSTLKLLACLQNVLKPLDVQQTKDLETTVAGIRADKVKEKTASDAAKKGGSNPTDGKKPLGFCMLPLLLLWARRMHSADYPGTSDL